jgi:hypothetical protein
MRRRKLIAGLGAAAAWPLKARGQQPLDRRPLVGMLMLSQDASSVSPCINAFSEGMSKLGWIDSRDYDIVYKYSDGEIPAGVFCFGNVLRCSQSKELRIFTLCSLQVRRDSCHGHRLTTRQPRGLGRERIQAF